MADVKAGTQDLIQLKASSVTGSVIDALYTKAGDGPYCRPYCFLVYINSVYFMSNGNVKKHKSLLCRSL